VSYEKEKGDCDDGLRRGHFRRDPTVKYLPPIGGLKNYSGKNQKGKGKGERKILRLVRRRRGWGGSEGKKKSSGQVQIQLKGLVLWEDDVP